MKWKTWRMAKKSWREVVENDWQALQLCRIDATDCRK